MLSSRLLGLFSIPHVFFLCVILGRFYCYVFKFPVFSSAISILLLIPSMYFLYQILYFSSRSFVWFFFIFSVLLIMYVFSFKYLKIVVTVLLTSLLVSSFLSFLDLFLLNGFSLGFGSHFPVSSKILQFLTGCWTF